MYTGNKTSLWFTLCLTWKWFFNENFAVRITLKLNIRCPKLNYTCSREHSKNYPLAYHKISGMLWVGDESFFLDQ